MRTGSLRGAPLAGLVSAYHAGHAGPCSVIRVASTRRKKLPTRRCGSAYPNCATCSPECCGADGTDLIICCSGPSGEDDINSEPCAATIESAVHLCLLSIYNCSTNPCFLDLPPQQHGSHAKARTHSSHQHQIALLQLARLHGRLHRQRNRSRRSIPILLNVD